jgi:diguanylate cyclase (GGDEF)-like protein
LLRLTRQADVQPVYEEDVNATLRRGFRWMYFPPRLERLFEYETQITRSGHLVAVGILWISIGLLYSFFPVTPDPQVAGELRVAQIIRLGVITPVLIAVTFAIWYGVQPAVREFLVMCANIIAPGSIILIVALVQGGEPGAIRGALTIVLLFITVVVRLRFWFATVACLTLVALQVGAPSLLGTQVPGNVPLVLATITAGLIANYTLEREYRLNYLQRVHGRIQGAKLAATVEQLHDLSQHDALTGLNNRRALDTQLDDLCARSEPFSVIILDVDSFKQFNDQYGHQVGDDCLRRVAAMLRASLRRTSDSVARLGGEEFAVVLPGTKLIDACTMAERMRKSILDLRIPHVGSPTDDVVSISAGVSEAKIPATPDEVLTSADKALYQAKAEGRNRVAVLRS